MGKLIRIRTEINETENSESKQKNQQNKCLFFKKVNKMNNYFQIDFQKRIQNTLKFQRSFFGKTLKKEMLKRTTLSETKNR